MTDTTRPDHAAEARDAIEALQRYNGDDDAYMAAHAHLTALAGERDALLAYGRMVTAFALEVGRMTGKPSDAAIAKMQEVCNVAHLFDAEGQG